MDVANQTITPLNTQSFDNFELDSKAKSNKLDFISILLNDSSNSANTIKASRHESHTEKTDTLSSTNIKDKSFSLLKGLSLHTNTLINNQSAPAHVDLTNKIVILTEKVSSSKSLQVHKNQTSYSSVGQSQLSTRKELYEQSAFAINKLSYLDVLHNSDILTYQSTLKNSESEIGVSDVKNNKTIAFTNMISDQVTPLMHSTTSSHDQDVIEKKNLNNASTILASNPYLIEKSRMMITSHKNEQHLYIRDHFSSREQIDSMVSNVMNSVRSTLSKIFVNGKER